MSLSCFLRLSTRFTGWPSSSPVVVRHRSSGWFVAPEGATDDAGAALQFDSEGVARAFVDGYTCEPHGFDVVPAAEVRAAA